MFIGGNKLGAGRSGVLFSSRPVRCDTGYAAKWRGGGWGWGFRDNLSLGSLMENRKALHSACERAAAGCDQQTASNTFAPQPAYSQSSQGVADVPMRQFHPSRLLLVCSFV